MGIRIGYVMELVLAVATGMALTRWVLLDPNMSHINTLPILQRLPNVTDPFLGGVALAGGLGLAIEAARRRSPPTWGIGRRTWSIAGLTVLFQSGAWVGMQLASGWRRRGTTPNLEAALDFTRFSIGTTFYPHAGLAIAAMGLTALFEGRAGQSPPDAREWAGRALLILIVVQALVVRSVAVFG